jgi:outer membrane protein TolC
MRRLRFELENRDIDLLYTQNQLLPVVDVFASYTQSGVGGRQTMRSGFGDSTVTQVLNGGLGDAFSQLFSYDYTGYAVGFSVEIPLRNRAAQGENARALTEKRSVESRLTATAQLIALEVRNALTVVEMNRARIEAAQTARQLTERRLDAENKKFELGASTIRFVLEEQRNVTQAQTNEIAALVNYTKALVDLDRAMGLTLRKNNIQIERSLNLTAAAR